MVEEGKAAHKRAEQIRRNEHSTLIVELEHCLPPEFLDGFSQDTKGQDIQKNGTLKAMLKYHKHQVAVIEKQLETVEAQAAKNAALEESKAMLMQRIQQIVAYEESPADLERPKLISTYFTIGYCVYISNRCRATLQPWSSRVQEKGQDDQVRTSKV